MKTYQKITRKYGILINIILIVLLALTAVQALSADNLIFPALISLVTAFYIWDTIKRCMMIVKKSIHKG